MARANVQLEVNASQAQRALGQVHRQTTALSGAVNKLKTAFLSIGAGAVIRQTVKHSVSLQSLKVRLELLTRETGTYGKSLKMVEKAQRNFNMSQKEALAAVTNITARLAPLGQSTEDIEATLMGFNTAAKLAGATGLESSNAFRQLAQALGSGRLQGDEFRSISEQIPTILKPIAEELDLTVGQLKEYASQGGLTSDKVISALKKIEKDGGKALQELIKNDPTTVFKNLSNETEDLSAAIGELLTPVVLEMTRLLTKLAEAATKFFESSIGKGIVISTALALALKAVVVSITIVNAAIVAFLTKLVTTGAAALIATGNITLLAAANTKLAATAMIAAGAMSTLKVALIKTGIGALIIAVGLAIAAFVEIADKQKRWNDLIKQGTVDELTAEMDKLNIKLDEQTEKLEKNVGWWAKFVRRIDVLKWLGTTTRKDLEDTKNKLKELDETLELRKAQEATQRIEDASNAMKGLANITRQTRVEFQETFAKKFGSYLKNVNDFGTQAAQLIQNTFQGMEDAIVNFVQTGKLNFRDFANSIIADMIRIAVRQAIIAPLLKSFTGMLIPGLASGGPVQANKPYIVGEEGPELFTPKTSGQVIPNNELSSGGMGAQIVGGSNTSITVNVDASGSEVEGNNEQGQMLGEVLAAAIQSELIKQKRPGGLLTA